MKLYLQIPRKTAPGSALPFAPGVLSTINTRTRGIGAASGHGAGSGPARP